MLYVASQSCFNHEDHFAKISQQPKQYIVKFGSKAFLTIFFDTNVNYRFLTDRFLSKLLILSPSNSTNI